MALDTPNSNKMMAAPPAKKGFHFAATAEHLAEFIEAATIQEAEAIYHKIKRPIGTESAAPASGAAPSASPELPPTNP